MKLNRILFCFIISAIILAGCKKDLSFEPESVQMNEDFSDNHRGWLVETTSEWNLFLNNGYYYVHSLNPASGVYSILNLYADLGKDFSVEISAQWDSGIVNNGYGIAFGTGSTNYYYFEISNNGNYTIRGRQSDTSVTVKPWTATSLVNTSSANVLKVENVGGTWSFYLNGNVLFSCAALSVNGTGFGFIVRELQYIKFDYIHVNYFFTRGEVW
jgi:hypothetical protein